MVEVFFSYKKQLIAVAGIIAIGSLVYSGYASWMHRQDEKASDAYAKALTLLEDLDKSDKETQEESDKAQKDNDMKKQKQLTQAQQAFRHVRLACPSCRVSRLAALNEAQLLLKLGEHQKALATYQTSMQNCSHSKVLCAWAILGQARVQEALGKHQQALDILEQATMQWQKTPAEPFLQWYMVRMAHHLGHSDKLQTYAAQLQERFPLMWMSQQAKQLMQEPTTGSNS